MTDTERKLLPAWIPQTMEDRLRACMAMLHIHGAMTDGERDKCLKRINKLIRAKKL